MGADELSRIEAREGLPEGLVSASAAAAAANAIQVVAQGQRSENLLDFGLDDEEPAASSSTPRPSAGNANNANGLFGLDFSSGGNAMSSPVMASQARSPPPANKQANTLDDLLGLFDSAGLGPGSNAGMGMPGRSSTPQAANGGNMFGPSDNAIGGGIMSPPSSSAKSPQPPQPPRNDDLMGDLF